MDSQFSWIENLTDEELFNKLKEFKVNIPVTDSSRGILRKRLAKLLGVPTSPSSDSSQYSRPGRTEEDFNSSYIDQTERSDDLRRRGHKGNDTFGNSFFIEEVDASPIDELRARRASEIEHLHEELEEQEKFSSHLTGEDAENSSSSSSTRTALIVLAILIAIGAFLIISYAFQAESTDDIVKMPSVKVVPAEQV